MSKRQGLGTVRAGSAIGLAVLALCLTSCGGDSSARATPPASATSQAPTAGPVAANLLQVCDHAQDAFRSGDLGDDEQAKALSKFGKPLGWLCSYSPWSGRASARHVARPDAGGLEVRWRTKRGRLRRLGVNGVSLARQIGLWVSSCLGLSRVVRATANPSAAAQPRRGSLTGGDAARRQPARLHGDSLLAPAAGRQRWAMSTITDFGGHDAQNEPSIRTRRGCPARCSRDERLRRRGKSQRRGPP